MHETILTVKVNGKMMNIDNGYSLANALALLGYESSFFAVAINQTFIPRNLYQETFIQNNDNIDIVAPMQGG